MFASSVGSKGFCSAVAEVGSLGGGMHIGKLVAIVEWCWPVLLNHKLHTEVDTWLAHWLFLTYPKIRIMKN